MIFLMKRMSNSVTVLTIIAIYAPVIYAAPWVMLLMRAASYTRASGKGLGPGNREFFGACEMALRVRVRDFLRSLSPSP
jgi:hypothetical protein